MSREAWISANVREKLSQMYWESMFFNEGQKLLPPDIARKSAKQRRAYLWGYYDAISHVFDVLKEKPL